MTTIAAEPSVEFVGFPKIGRYSREAIATEKLDGTNGQLYVEELDGCAADGAVYESNGLALWAGSRTRWVTPAADNYGFARWAAEHGEELLQLGRGRHFGEWWGSGIQRGYGLAKGEKRFSLFNVVRWCLAGRKPQQIPKADPRLVVMQDVLPACVGLVPVLWRGPFHELDVGRIMAGLAASGSHAAPGFIHPEGIVVYHTAGNVGFKKTFVKDDLPKSLAK